MVSWSSRCFPLVAVGAPSAFVLASLMRIVVPVPVGFLRICVVRKPPRGCVVRIATVVLLGSVVLLSGEHQRVRHPFVVLVVQSGVRLPVVVVVLRILTLYRCRSPHVIVYIGMLVVVSSAFLLVLVVRTVPSHVA